MDNITFRLLKYSTDLNLYSEIALKDLKSNLESIQPMDIVNSQMPFKVELRVNSVMLAIEPDQIKSFKMFIYDAAVYMPLFYESNSEYSDYR